MIEVLGTTAEMDGAAELVAAREALGPEAAAWDLRACRIAARLRLAIVEGSDSRGAWAGARHGVIDEATIRAYIASPYADEPAQRAAWAGRIAQLRAVADADNVLPGDVRLPSAEDLAGA